MKKHTLEVYELVKGNYNQGDTLVYFADGLEISITGVFYVKDGILHHTHIFNDGVEMEITITY